MRVPVPDQPAVTGLVTAAMHHHGHTQTHLQLHATMAAPSPALSSLAPTARSGGPGVWGPLRSLLTLLYLPHVHPLHQPGPATRPLLPSGVPHLSKQLHWPAHICSRARRPAPHYGHLAFGRRLDPVALAPAMVSGYEESIPTTGFRLPPYYTQHGDRSAQLARASRAHHFSTPFATDTSCHSPSGPTLAATSGPPHTAVRRVARPTPSAHGHFRTRGGLLPVYSIPNRM